MRIPVIMRKIIGLLRTLLKISVCDLTSLLHATWTFYGLKGFSDIEKKFLGMAKRVWIVFV